MRQRLYPPDKYPDGHPAVAESLHNLAFVLEAQGRSADAEPFCRDTLAMRRRLYPPDKFPNGHPELAVILDNLAIVLDSQGRLSEADARFREALAMY